MFLTESSKSPAEVAKADCEYPIEYVCRRLRVTVNGVNSND